MSTKNDGGPAYPVQDASAWQGHGMSLRDYFAAEVMQAGLTGAALPGLDEGDPDSVAALRKAVLMFWIIADEMIAARDK